MRPHALEAFVNTSKLCKHIFTRRILFLDFFMTSHRTGTANGTVNCNNSTEHWIKVAAWHAKYIYLVDRSKFQLHTIPWPLMKNWNVILCANNHFRFFYKFNSHETTVRAIFPNTYFLFLEIIIIIITNNNSTVSRSFLRAASFLSCRIT